MILFTGSPGAPDGAVYLAFFLTSTSTPSPIYQDADGDHAHTNPVVADASGVFPPIYVDPTITYRVVYSVSEDLSDVVWETDPYVPPGQGVSSFNGRGGTVTLSDEDVANALGFTPAPDDAATTSAPGIVQLATDEEVQAGLNAVKVITPASLLANAATESHAGVIEIATDAEYAAGTDDDRAITPKKRANGTVVLGPYSIAGGTKANNLTHGLDAKPKVTAKIVCKVSELGYAIGSELFLSNFSTSNSGISYGNVDSTKLFFVIGSSGLLINGYTATTTAAPTTADWDLYLIASIS